MNKRGGRWLCWAALAAPLSAWAGDGAVAELLGRIGSAGTAEFRYEETRTLELAAAPMQAQGYLFSNRAGDLVKLQLLPRRIIMAISGGRMLYHDPEQKQRFSAPLSFAGDARQQITLFQTLLQGRVDALQASYEASVERQGQHWTLKLQPKPGPAAEGAPALEMSGNDDGPQRQIIIRQADGETSRYLLEKTGEEQRLEFSIQRLLLEALGE
jgi:hypothetical protein